MQKSAIIHQMTVTRNREFITEIVSNSYKDAVFKVRAQAWCVNNYVTICF